MNDNATLAELLARAADREQDRKGKALRRAARRALMWPEEARDLLEQGRSLTELRAVGPYVARVIEDLLDRPIEDPVPPTRQGFITRAHAARVIAERGSLPVRGDLQMHTLYSDGSTRIEEMAERCIELGHTMMSITDHSKGLAIANGMHEDRLREQGREIASLRDRYAGRIDILRSIEMNISPDGSGDMDPAALAELDIVLGAFHSKLRLKEDQTERYLAALANPTINVLAHPRGRIWNFRLGLSADWARVCAEAARVGKALEIDCYPDRQDLNVDLLRIARDAGCSISIGTDAHHPDELAFIDLGIAAAREADTPADRILNCMPPEELRAWARQMRTAA